MELGGFAEAPEAIDATQEEFEAFNYCLACDYLAAMVAEDFELLGEMGFDTIESVTYWLNYDGEIGESIKDQIAAIPQGNLVTINNRPLYEAAIENNDFNLVTIFLYNGNHDVRLFLTMITETPLTEYREISILNVIFRDSDVDLSNCITFFNSLFSMLEEKYVLLETPEEKAKFLRKIKPYIASIRIPSEFKNDIRMTQIAKMNKYSWQKALRL